MRASRNLNNCFTRWLDEGSRESARFLFFSVAGPRCSFLPLQFHLVAELQSHSVHISIRNRYLIVYLEMRLQCYDLEHFGA